MMKKNTLIIFIILIFATILFITLFKLNDKKVATTKNIIITKYDYQGNKEKEVIIENEEEKKIIRKYISKLSPLKTQEMVNLALMKDIEITDGNSISIDIQLEETTYCYYINKDKNITSLSKLPTGLYDFVTKKLTIK